MAAKSNKSLNVETIRHVEDRRRLIPTAEYESVMNDDDKSPIQVAYARRNRDLDPQLVWRGKDEQDWSDLVVAAPPLYIQEKVHPKVLIEDLRRATQDRAQAEPDLQLDLFADFNGVPENATATEFYQHDANWTNRMILGDSLQVMASLAEREGLRGKVQCIYFDPPYGIKFNSNFQWSTSNRDVRDGKTDHITREPEQVKAFRDTWRDGIHSYLTYIRDRLTVARDLLTESGSVFVQIGDENVHRIRAVLDEVFGNDNFVSLITFKKSSSATERYLASTSDYIIWFAKNLDHLKYRPVKNLRTIGSDGADAYRLHEFLPGHWRSLSQDELRDAARNPKDYRILRLQTLTSQRQGRDTGPTGAMSFPVEFHGETFLPSRGRGWTTTRGGIQRLIWADRIGQSGRSINYKRYFSDSPSYPIYNIWDDTQSGSGMDKVYVVQTNTKVIERCLLMATDPGDLVLDPTCGSGTTAYAAEQWGRRWITIDTSRVALALARARIMGARYPYFLLADSTAGQRKEAEVTRTAPSTAPVYNNVRQGFVYERVPHIMLKDIANNTEIDVIWTHFQETLEPLRAQLNDVMGKAWEEWEIPRRAEDPWADDARALFRSLRQELKKGDAADGFKVQQLLRTLNGTLKRDYTADTLPRRPADPWPKAAAEVHAQWWEGRIARQREIDASIAAQADQEFLYDKPYEDRSVVRVAGPFTVESLSPHRVLTVDADDELVLPGQFINDEKSSYGDEIDFTSVILENLKTAGVQQSHKEDRITFTSLVGWPGHYLCAEGRYLEGESNKERRAGIFIGPEFGTVPRADLVAAAREAADAGFDVLIACAFNYDAHSAEFERLGRIPVLKARMNADLHMADALKNTGAGNLFVIFGEPDITVNSGKWLVTRSGRMVAPYGSVTKLPGLGSVEAINRLGREDLPRLKRLSSGREVWADQSGTAGGGLGAGEHRGRGSTQRDGGISSESERSQRLPGRSGDAADPGASVELPAGNGSQNSVAGSSRNRQDAQWPEALSGLQTLQPADFPLTLTTDHFTQVTIHGVDIFHPQSGQVRSSDPDDIACWFIDTNYNEESFFVRHAYFLGANDPYKALKTTLKAEIDHEAWSTLHSDTSRPFPKPETGRIAVKVINHLGDEVMKVFSVG